MTHEMNATFPGAAVFTAAPRGYLQMTAAFEGAATFGASVTTTFPADARFSGTGGFSAALLPSVQHEMAAQFSGTSTLTHLPSVIHTLEAGEAVFAGTGGLTAELCFANGMTVPDALDAIADIWGVTCSCDGNSEARKEALIYLNTAIQRLFQTGKLHGFVNRVQRSYTGTKRVGNNWLRTVTLEDDVQSIDGNVEFWFPGPHWKLFFNVATTTVSYVGYIKFDAEVFFSDGTSETFIMSNDLVTDFIARLTELKSLWVRTNSATSHHVVVYNPGSTGTGWRPMMAYNGKEIDEIRFSTGEILACGDPAVLGYVAHRHLLRPVASKAELESARERASAIYYPDTHRVGDNIWNVSMPIYYLARATATPAGSRESISEAAFSPTITVDGGDA